jgi:hypothetical protein
MSPYPHSSGRQKVCVLVTVAPGRARRLNVNRGVQHRTASAGRQRSDPVYATARGAGQLVGVSIHAAVSHRSRDQLASLRRRHHGLGGSGQQFPNRQQRPDCRTVELFRHFQPAEPVLVRAPKKSPRRTPSEKPSDALIGIEEAAQILGYSVSGVRKIINRSRRRLRGEPVAGPTIRLFQAGPKGPIKSKRQWIDDFIRANTSDPSAVALHPETQSKRHRSQPDSPSIVPPEVGPTLGFDPSFYDV